MWLVNLEFKHLKRNPRTCTRYQNSKTPPLLVQLEINKWLSKLNLPIISHFIISPVINWFIWLVLFYGFCMLNSSHSPHNLQPLAWSGIKYVLCLSGGGGEGDTCLSLPLFDLTTDRANNFPLPMLFFIWRPPPLFA